MVRKCCEEHSTFSWPVVCILATFCAVDFCVILFRILSSLDYLGLNFFPFLVVLLQCSFKFLIIYMYLLTVVEECNDVDRACGGET
jgi:hypothetical protein